MFALQWSPAQWSRFIYLLWSGQCFKGKCGENFQVSCCGFMLQTGHGGTNSQTKLRETETV